MIAWVSATIGALWDMKSGRIPNQVNLLLLAAALTAATLSGTFVFSFALAGLAFFSIFLIHLVLGGFGGGDMKMIPGLAALTGNFSTLLLAGALSFGIPTILAIFLRKKNIRMGPYMVLGSYAAISAL
tara:strand:- start:586 stop:969 length:384 start_codon:yes stop_codon:yes gene_type:complete